MPPRKARTAGENHQSTTNASSVTTATTRLTRSAAKKAAETEQKAKAVIAGAATTTKPTNASSNSKAAASKGKAKRTTRTSKAKVSVATERTESPPKKRGRQRKTTTQSPQSPQAPAPEKELSSKRKQEFPVPTQLSSPPVESDSEQESKRLRAKPPPKTQKSATKSTSHETKTTIESKNPKPAPKASNNLVTSSRLSEKEPEMRSRMKRAREEDVLVNGNTNVVDLSPSKTKKLKTSPAKGSRSINSKFSELVCKSWFDRYASTETGVIDTPKAIQWFGELEISIGCVAYFVLAYKLAAKTLFTITRQEFMEGMRKLNVDSNEKLKLKFPSLLSELEPSHDSDQFRAFYKFCFEYIKSGEPAGSKNIPLDPWAIEFLPLTLDKKKYSIDYKPPEDEPTVEDTKLAEKGDENFPHLHTFIQFLKLKKPMKVLTKDQWDCFLPFNKGVGWNLEGYDEAESSWPSLFDQYIEWKKEMSNC